MALACEMAANGAWLTVNGAENNADTGEFMFALPNTGEITIVSRPAEKLVRRWT